MIYFNILIWSWLIIKSMEKVQPIESLTSIPAAPDYSVDAYQNNAEPTLFMRYLRNIKSSIIA